MVHRNVRIIPKSLISYMVYGTNNSITQPSVTVVSWVKLYGAEVFNAQRSEASQLNSQYQHTNGRKP